MSTPNVDPALLKIFETEVIDAVQTMQADLLQVERAGEPPGELLTEMLRLAHGIKGSANTIGYRRVGELAHAMEARLVGWKGLPSVPAKDVDLLLGATDVMRELTLDPQSAAVAESLRSVLDQLATNEPGALTVGEGPRGASKRGNAPGALLRVPRSLIDKVADGAALILADSLSAQVRLKDLNRAFARLGAVQLPSDVDREISQSRKELRAAIFGVRQVVSMFDEHTRSLAEQSRDLSLVPIAGLIVHLERVARDAAKELGREVELKTEDCDRHIDMLLLEAVKTPLTHLVRNAIDHGIEPPSQRRSAGKAPRGTITIGLREEGDRICFVVRDDGRGIDVEKLRRKLGDSARGLDDQALLSMFLRAGVSTRDEATLISGRGIGLGAAAAAVDELRGDMQVESKPGRGTSFTLEFPTHLSLVHGLVVKDAGLTLVLPLRGVVAQEERPSVEQRRLSSALGLDAKAEARCSVRLRGRTGEISFAVEQIIDIEELVRRPLGEHLGRVRFIEGATILPHGEPALILDVRELVDSNVPEGARPSTKALRVLVVDDSAMMRAHLCSELAAAGCQVLLAEDGEIALQILATQSLDVVVSDVQMPRISGLQLLEACAGRLPVILITSFPCAEDEIRATSLGASAYFAKDDRVVQRIVDVLHSCRTRIPERTP